jgi:hypothetical protein
MSEKINWTLNVQVTAGPKIQATQTMTVDAYDKIDVSIVDGVADEEVQVQPGGAEQVHFLLIYSDQYGDSLTYKINDPGATPVKLDALQLLMGEGAVGLLEAAAVKLFFSNSMGKDAAVQILVGRKATS